MKSFMWFISVALAVASMTGFFFLSDADLFDLFKSGSSYNQRTRWKRSRLYPQYVLPLDQDRQRYYQHQEEDGNQHHSTQDGHSKTSDSVNSHRSRLSSTEIWSNEDYAQLMPRPTPFPPNHFINQPYFETKLPPKTTAHSLRTYSSVANRQQLYTERPITSNHKVTREVHHNIDHPTKRTSFISIPMPSTQMKDQRFSDLDIALASSESKSKPSFTKMFQKAISRRKGETKLKKSVKQKEGIKATQQEVAQQRDYRHGGGSYGGGSSYHQPPVYYIPNHHKEKDFSVVLKLFLLAILIPLGICIALAVIAAFFTGISAYGRYLVTYVNATNTTYYLINGLSGFGGLTNLFGLSGLVSGTSTSSVATAAIAQQQQQQQASNNNNNNDNNSNNNNNVAVIVVNVTGRANKDGNRKFFSKPFKIKPIKQDEDEGTAMDYF